MWSVTDGHKHQWTFTGSPYNTWQACAMHSARAPNFWKETPLTVLFKTRFAVWLGLVKSVLHNASLVPSNLIYGFLNTLRRQMACHGSRAIWGMNCLRSLGRWDHEFESNSRHECLVCMRIFCVCLETGWSLVQGVLPPVTNYYGTE
jgi:hypothetical protein